MTSLKKIVKVNVSYITLFTLFIFICVINITSCNSVDDTESSIESNGSLDDSVVNMSIREEVILKEERIIVDSIGSTRGSTSHFEKIDRETQSESKSMELSPNGKNLYTVTIYYGTDRNTNNKKDLKNFYGPNRNSKDNIEQGIVEVNIPGLHKVGVLELPEWWRLWNSTDPEQFFLLNNIQPQSETVFYGGIKDFIQYSSEKEAFIFIHGYNTTFKEAALRTAQFAFDLNYHGVPILYSWPSQGTVTGYLADEDNIKWTIPHFRKFLHNIIHQTGVKKLNLIAHSMGNRALTEILTELPQKEKALINQVLLAAPDIDADVFKRDIAPKIKGNCKRITVYASSNDKALIKSKQIHKNRRVGETGSNIFTFQGIETIDASDLDSEDLFDHSYFIQSRPVIEDIFKLFKFNAEPKDRNLTKRNCKEGSYWAFKK